MESLWANIRGLLMSPSNPDRPVVHPKDENPIMGLIIGFLLSIVLMAGIGLITFAVIQVV